MAGFSIDDVRETLPGDVTRLLDAAEGAASRSLAVLGANGLESPELGADLIALGEAGHAVHGTCSLVGADSLASSAKVLEELALRAEEELRKSHAHALSARRAVEACFAGAAEMRGML